MAEERQNETGSKHLTTQEIKDIVSMAKQPGLRFTVDHYLLDYIKHCFLEDDQLSRNIEKLDAALLHLEDSDARKGVQDVISSLRCVQSEYSEYVEDMRVLSNGGYPEPRGVA